MTTTATPSTPGDTHTISKGGQFTSTTSNAHSTGSSPTGDTNNRGKGALSVLPVAICGDDPWSTYSKWVEKPEESTFYLMSLGWDKSATRFAPSVLAFSTQGSETFEAVESLRRTAELSLTSALNSVQHNLFQDDNETVDKEKEEVFKTILSAQLTRLLLDFVETLPSGSEVGDGAKTNSESEDTSVTARSVNDRVGSASETIQPPAAADAVRTQQPTTEQGASNGANMRTTGTVADDSQVDGTNGKQRSATEKSTTNSQAGATDKSKADSNTSGGGSQSQKKNPDGSAATSRPKSFLQLNMSVPLDKFIFLAKTQGHPITVFGASEKSTRLEDVSSKAGSIPGGILRSRL